MYLPQSFHGQLIIKSNGKHNLTPELQARSVRVSPPDLDPKDVAYRIGEKGGPSTAVAKTTNSGVTVGTVAAVVVAAAAAASSKPSESCVVC